MSKHVSKSGSGFAVLALAFVCTLASAAVASLSDSAVVATGTCDANYCTGSIANCKESVCCCKSKVAGGGYGPYSCQCIDDGCDGKDRNGRVCQ